MDLKVDEQRTEPRVAVQFRTMVSDSVEAEGTGVLLDLSQNGCRLESPLLMLPGLSVALRIAVPGFEWALMIDGADVQWADEDRAGLAFVRIRETERQRLHEVVAARLAKGADTNDDAQGELIPCEFQGLEAVLAKDPTLAVSKGLAWFAQDPTEFRFRGGSLLSRAFPTCTPNFAAALGELVKAGGDKEADFSLALLQNYLGSTSTDSVVKEIVSRFSDDDRIMGEVRTIINSPNMALVSGEFALAEAWRVKKESLTHWLTDERRAVSSFAEQHLAELNRMITAERHRVETERELRERSRHEEESGHDHGYRPKPF
ncbi:MAG: PilZ domain-containing protein [Nitrospira sp.]|nr:PilZ domain-containing protein [Nitrospira sp.]MBX3350529.1 PilZ domain-containing protein [Nitrospira sp.]